jgi:transcriptional regulator with XRE-family HTH domain
MDISMKTIKVSRAALKEYMKYRGLTKGDVAYKCGISVPTIYRYLNGDIKKIHPATRDAFARLLGGKIRSCR